VRVWFPSLNQSVDVEARDLLRLEIVEVPAYFYSPEDTECKECGTKFQSTELIAPTADSNAYCCAPCWKTHLRKSLIDYIWTAEVGDHTMNELKWHGETINDRFLRHILSEEKSLVGEYLAVQRAKLSCEDPEKPRPCHGCKRLIFKHEACDHVTCKCGSEMCWKCGGKYGKCAPCPGVFTPETLEQLRTRVYNSPGIKRVQKLFRRHNQRKASVRSATNDRSAAERSVPPQYRL